MPVFFQLKFNNEYPTYIQYSFKIGNRAKGRRLA